VKSKAKYGKNGKDLYVNVIQCKCLASMRSTVYTVNIVVNKKEKCAFLKSLLLDANECAAGNVFCAHMLGLSHYRVK